MQQPSICLVPSGQPLRSATRLPAALMLMVVVSYGSGTPGIFVHDADSNVCNLHHIIIVTEP